MLISSRRKIDAEVADFADAGRVRELLGDGFHAAYLVGALMVYMNDMGTVLRCTGCDNALIRIARGPGRYWLDLRGVKYLQIEQAR
jgi:hypothetical protein